MNSSPAGVIPFLHRGAGQFLPTLLHQPCGNGELQGLSLRAEGAGQCRRNPSSPRGLGYDASSIPGQDYPSPALLNAPEPFTQAELNTTTNSAWISFIHFYYNQILNPSGQ